MKRRAQGNDNVKSDNPEVVVGGRIDTQYGNHWLTHSNARILNHCGESMVPQVIVGINARNAGMLFGGDIDAVKERG